MANAWKMVTASQMAPVSFDREEFLRSGRFRHQHPHSGREMNGWMVEKYPEEFSDQFLWQFCYRVYIAKRVNLTYMRGTGAAWMDFLSCNRGSFQLLPVVEFPSGSLYVTSGEFKPVWNTQYLIEGDGRGFPWFDAWPIIDLFIAEIGGRMRWSWDKVFKFFDLSECRKCGAHVKPMPAKNTINGMCWQCGSALPR